MSDPILNYRFVIFLPNFIISFTGVYVNIKLGQIDILKLGHFLPVQPFFCNP